MGASTGGIGNRRQDDDAPGDTFAVAEEWEQYQRGNNQDLNHDGEEKSALLALADASFLSGIAFDEAVTQKTETIFGTRGDSHHTPPENFSARRGNFAAPVS